MTYVLENPSMANFGQALERLRRERYWSQDDLAAKARVSRSTVQKAESSSSNKIQASKYRALAEALGLTPAQLDKEWRVGGIEQSIGDPVRRGLPLINKAPAGNVTDYQECSMVDSGQGAWYVQRDGIEDPHAFGVIITGESMTPTLLNKSLVIFSPMDQDGRIAHTQLAVPDGHIVFVRFGADAKIEGCTVARLSRKAGKIHLTKDNKAHKTIICRPEEIVSMAAMVRYEPFQKMVKIFQAAEQLASKGELDAQVEGRIHPE